MYLQIHATIETVAGAVGWGGGRSAQPGSTNVL